MELEKTLEKMTRDLMEKTGSSVSISVDMWAHRGAGGIEVKYHLFFTPGLYGDLKNTSVYFRTWPELFRRYRELMATDDIAGLETPNSDNIEEAA